MREGETVIGFGTINRGDGSIWVVPGRWAQHGVVFVRARDIPAPRHGWTVYGNPTPADVIVRIER